MSIEKKKKSKHNIVKKKGKLEEEKRIYREKENVEFEMIKKKQQLREEKAGKKNWKKTEQRKWTKLKIKTNPIL